MLIGIPKELKNMECRVGATPAAVQMLVHAGHSVQVETFAGEKSGFSDEMYFQSGAEIVNTAQEIYQNEMIIKVKEPLESEYPLLKEDQIIFCYLHLAPDLQQTKALLEKKVIGVAYETITDDKGRLPLLAPMSEVAGRLAVQIGATALQTTHGGKGVLLGGIPGVHAGRVVVFGGGVVGTESIKMAVGLGADVIVFDNSLQRLRELDQQHFKYLKTLYPTTSAIEEALKKADLVIGAVLVAGGKAPKLVTREMVKKMEKGSVLVDVAIDQGGCFETSRLTSHSDPTFVEEGVIHYGVPNMPALCPKTSTYGLTNAVLPYALKIANLGILQAIQEDEHIKAGVNTFRGYLTNKNVASSQNAQYVDVASLLPQGALA